jgi:hypothetical protein
MKVINVYGAPCSRKTTFSMALFVLLKMHKINCEFISESAKMLTWENRQIPLHDRLYMLGEASLRLSILNGKVDVVVSEGPVLTNLLYSKPLNEDIVKVHLQKYKEFDNIDFFLHRIDPLGVEGRNETSEEQVDKMEKELRDILDSCGVGYTLTNGTHGSINKAFDYVAVKLGLNKRKYFLFDGSFY